MELGTHVESILVEEGRAAGVKLRNGNTVAATKAVISNAAIWDTLKLLPPGAVPDEWAESMAATPQCESFMHLHLGIDATGLPDDLEIHHIVVDDWDLGTCIYPAWTRVSSIPAHTSSMLLSAKSPRIIPPFCYGLLSNIEATCLLCERLYEQNYALEELTFGHVSPSSHCLFGNYSSCH